MTDFETIEQIEKLAATLSPTDQALLLQRLAGRLHDPSADDDAPNLDLILTDEEVAELFNQPRQPMRSRALAHSEFMGVWAHKGITDSVEWLLEQRRLRRAATNEGAYHLR